MQVFKVLDHFQNKIVGEAQAELGLASVKFEGFEFQSLLHETLLKFHDEFVVPREQRNLASRMVDLA